MAILAMSTIMIAVIGRLQVEGQKQSNSNLLVSSVGFRPECSKAARPGVSQKNSWNHAPLPLLSLVSPTAPGLSLVKRFGLDGDWSW